MYILALDQATKITGYAYFENEILLKYGAFKSHDPASILRIEEIIQQIENFIKINKIDLLILEDIQLQEEDDEISIPTFKTLSKLLGAIELLAIKYNINYKIITPTKWRTDIGINTFKKNRTYLKAQALLYVQNKFNIEMPIDVAEAICIGQSYIESKKKPALAWGYK